MIRVSFESQKFEAAYVVQGAPWRHFYRGSLAAPESLTEACVTVVPQLLTELLDVYAAELRKLDGSG
jgi:hypothetical protein